MSDTRIGLVRGLKRSRHRDYVFRYFVRINVWFFFFCLFRTARVRDVTACILSRSHRECRSSDRGDIITIRCCYCFYCTTGKPPPPQSIRPADPPREHPAAGGELSPKTALSAAPSRDDGMPSHGTFPDPPLAARSATAAAATVGPGTGSTPYAAARRRTTCVNENVNF